MTLVAGLHYGIPDADYRADPCPEPSLTQSIGKILLSQSPAHAWLAHPRLNPDWQADDDTRYDLGTVAHAMLLGRSRDLTVLDYPDWRTKASQEARQAAWETHTLAVLQRDWDRATEMRGAILRQLRERGYGDEWSADPEQAAEVVAIAHANAWKDGRPVDMDTTMPPIWLRAMLDWVPSRTSVWDLKTSGRSAAPAELWRQVFDMGWPLQAAMHERILDLLYPEDAGRRAHRFIAVENAPPYALSIVRMTEALMTIGRHQLARAETIWATCMLSGKWPAYSLIDQLPQWPAWALKGEMEHNDA